MQVSNLPSRVLICEDAGARFLSNTTLDIREIHCWNGLHLYDPGRFADDLHRSLGDIKQLRIHRCYDRFYLWMPENNEDQRQSLLDGFFELIGDEYESLIDVRRNLGNIHNLLHLVCQLAKPSEVLAVIDYGCGTGLSMRIAPQYKVGIIGVERCAIMRAKAAAQGMQVWSQDDLARQVADSLPAAFASYVFHLLPHTNDLRLLWSRLKLGGVLVANFHKGEGIEHVDSCLGELNAKIIRLESPDASTLHGPYIAYVKEA